MVEEDEVPRASGASAMKVAGALAAAPFVAHLEVNGLNYVKLGCGVLACVMLFIAGKRYAAEEDQQKSGLGLAVLILGVGIFHVITSGAVR